MRGRVSSVIATETGISVVATLVRVPVSRLLLCLALLPAAVSAQGAESGDGDPLSRDLIPAPVLSPEDVVRIQLEALRHNDERNRGIEVAFRFASPANRVHTGPLPRFIGMIRNGPYALMLDFRAVSYGPVESNGTQARQRVILTDATTSVAYWFYLSRQSKDPYVDCWMTDAVFIEPAEGRSA